jgi:uncharacterized C2H2 Zn-finger protein
MSRLVREERAYERQCEGKRAWGTKARAKKVLARLQRVRHRDNLCVYRCPHCGGFHIGNDVPRRG